MAVSYRFEDVYGDNKETEAFLRGQALFLNGKVVFVQPMLLGADKIFVSKIVDNTSDYSVRLIFDTDGRLRDSYCTCTYPLDKGVCPHKIAVSLKSESLYNLKSKKLKEKEIVSKLIEDYFTSGKSGEQEIKLEPILVLDYSGNAYLRLEIGSGKMYEIKNPQEFCSLSKEHISLENEKGTLIEFVCTVLDELAKLGETESQIKAGGVMYLSRVMLDRFFDIYENQRIRLGRFNSKRDGGERLITDEVPYISLLITKSGSQYVCTSNLDDFEHLKGEKHIYLFGKQKITRLSIQLSESLERFLNTFILVKKLHLSENAFKEYYDTVISKIIPYLDISTIDVDFVDLQPSELTAKIYLDMSDNNHITGNLECFYNNSPCDIFKNEQQSVVRDYASETILKDCIQKYFGLKSSTLFLVGEEAIFTLMSEGIDELTSICEVYVTDKLKNVAIKRPSKLNIGVKLEGDLLSLKVGSDEYSDEDLKQILEAYKLKKKYTQLKSGIFVDTASPNFRAIEGLTRLFDLDSDGLVDGRVHLERFKAPFLDSVLKDTDGIYFERDRNFKNIIQDMTIIEDAEFEIPSGLKQHLRKYQKTGYRWLRTLAENNFGGILADDMGLGKTLQMIAFLRGSLKKGEKAIVVCPTSLILNWRNEFVKWGSGIEVVSGDGSIGEREKTIKDVESYDVIVTSYELLRNDIDLYKNIRFAYAIIDEAQYIKNHNTKNARSVKMLNAGIRFAMTGTPIENNLSELWSIFDFIMPNYLKSYRSFRQKFEIPIVKDRDESALSILHHLVKPFVLRRIKNSVLKELPDKIESVVHASLEGAQKDVYYANLALAQAVGSQSLQNKNKIEILALLTRLRQICCSPSLVYQDYDANNAKLDLCLDLLNSSISAGHKVLLFSQFTSMMDIIEKRLDAQNIKYFDLRGNTPKPERMRLIEKFNRDDTPVFLLSLKSGGTGLNLTGADVVIHYDPWWNLSVQSQATDRAHRLGQSKTVHVYKLILSGTVEEKILRLQTLKKSLSDLVIREGENFLSRLSMEEILSLLY